MVFEYMNIAWKIAEPITKETLDAFPDMHPLTVQLLWNRGLRTQKEIEQFLTPDYHTDSHDPFLFKDMRKAVDRILLAREKKEQVVIFGDYDADGVCASAILHDVLQQMDLIPHIHLPHRELEGYGMNMKAAQEFKKMGKSLVITCDCGISNVEEIAYLQDQGIDVIVTDHHEEPKILPPAFATLNPHVSGETYPFKHLVGTGVAFKLTQALMQTCREKGIGGFRDGQEKWFLDLVAIATIADYGDLIGENRIFTKFGLVVFEKTQRKGLRALLKLAPLKNPIDATSVAFQIVPRLNAASRMEHANTALNLLIGTDEAEALTIAQKLDSLNRDRQKASDAMFASCIEQIGENPTAPMLIAKGDGWGAGLLGLVAGKLLHRYHRPILVIGVSDEGCVGSGRSIPQFDITNALEKNSKLLQKFGGHPQACGFSFERKKLDAFCTAMEKSAAALSLEAIQDTLSIDAELPLDSINWEVWDDLRQFAPFGEGNPRPVFMAKEVIVEGVRSVGAAGKHLQVLVRHDTGMVQKTIAFGFAENWHHRLPRGSAIDIAYDISENIWNGNRELQIKLIDIIAQTEL